MFKTHFIEKYGRVFSNKVRLLLDLDSNAALIKIYRVCLQKYSILKQSHLMNAVVAIINPRPISYIVHYPGLDNFGANYPAKHFTVLKQLINVSDHRKIN